MEEYLIELERLDADEGRATARGKQGEAAVDIAREDNPRALNPAELLLTAVGGCLLKNISKLAPKMHLKIAGVRVKVSGWRTDDPPRITAIRYKLELFTAEPRAHVERLHRYLREYGTVYNTVSGGVELSGEAVIHDPNDISSRSRPGGV